MDFGYFTLSDNRYQHNTWTPEQFIKDIYAKERTLPHVIVKLWPGRSEQQKMRLAEEIVKDVMNVLNSGEESVSVAIEEVPAQEWAEKVYKPDILNNSEKLYKKPGYTM